MIDVSMRPLHIIGTEIEIDSDWVDADPVLDAPWQKKMVLSDYHAYFGPGTQEFDAGQIIKYVHPDSGEEITFQAQQLQWTNDLDQIEPIADPQQVTPASIVEDRIYWTGAYASGLDFEWESRTTGLAKYLHIDNLSAIGSPPQFIIDGGHPVLRLQFIFQKSNAVSVWVDGAEWNENPSNPVSTANNVEFKLSSTGETVWYFKTPNVDANFDAYPADPFLYRFRKSGPNLLVEVRVPWEYLQQAEYPLVIDPTVEYDVAASTDDAEQKLSNNAMNLTFTSLRFCNINDTWVTGMRWLAVTIPSGATIDSAYIVFRADAADSGTDFYTDWWGEDSSTPGTFTSTGSDITNRTSTTATVAWDSPETWANNSFYNSPELKTIVQELQDSYDYSSGLAMVLVNQYDSGEDERVADSQDNGADEPRLHIEYTEAGDFEVDETDGATIGESVTIDPLVLAGVELSEGLTVGDTVVNVTVIEGAPEDNDITGITDNITVGEAITAQLDDLETTKSDGLTVGESVSTALDDEVVSVSDGLTVGESVSVTLDDETISVSDGITVGESTSAELDDETVSVSDGLTVGESTTTTLDDEEISVSDGITLGELTDISVSEAGAISVSESDDIALGENVTISLDALEIDTSDGITVGESTTVALGALGVFEVSVSDGITLGESTSVTISDPTFSVTDGLTVGESTTVSVGVVGELDLSVSDGITLGESSTVTISDPTLSVSDGITFGESTTVSIEAIGALSIDISDGLTLGESVTFSMSDLTMTLTDSVTIADVPNLSLLVAIVESWTLQSRSTAWTIEDRDLDWSIQDRSTAWTLEDR